MIKRIGTTTRASKVVKYNGVAYLSGQVAEGATIWLSDMSYFSGLNEIWNAWVPEGHAPARACGEAKLARSELMVEIIVDAACD